jgi:hypothetical protein
VRRCEARPVEGPGTCQQDVLDDDAPGYCYVHRKASLGLLRLSRWTVEPRPYEPSPNGHRGDRWPADPLVELFSWADEPLTALEEARDRGRGVTARLAEMNHQAQCGTTGGYFRHRRLGQATCQRCRDAYARKARERRGAR